jgi:putative ABC transport system permease protein
MERSWIIRLLRWFCPPHLLEEIEGDLLQRFERDVNSVGERRAKRRLLWNVIRFFRPGILLRNKSSIDLTLFNMISNYFKVALRVMLRNKRFSAINISGLALGITGSLLLFLWIAHEMSFDEFHKDKDRLYVGWNRALENGQIVCWETTPRVLAPTLKEEYSFVESSASYANWGVQHLFMVGDKRILKSTGVFTDSAFLTMFSFPLLKGDPTKAFSNPNSIVLTEKFAKELFGDQEAFGEAVTISQSGYRFEFTVTGVMKNLPANTLFNFDYLLSFGFLESIGEKDAYWGNNSVTTLVKLKEGSDLPIVNESIKDIEKKNYADGQHIEIFLHPLTKMRLHSRFENGVMVGGRIEIVRTLGALGICLVAIAAINFINLSTARAQKRSKEVAIRKVTGAFRHALVTQFLCEAVLMAVGAGAVSFVAVYLLLPFFNTLINQQLSLEITDSTFWIIGGALILGIGFLAGSYPAVYLSAFKPVRILKGNLMASSKSVLRNLLVVFQFGFAVTLIISAIVVRKQIIHVQNRDAGYSKDNLVYIPLEGDLKKNYLAFKGELEQSGIVASISKTSAPITEQWSSTGGIEWRGKNPENRTDFERIYIDEKFVTTAGLQLIMGRDMDLERLSTDSTTAILNETALRVMGFKNPIGEVIKDNGQEWRVIGVVKDFVFTSPYKKIEPIVLFGGKAKWAFNIAYIKLNGSKPIEESLSTMQELSKKYNPEYPFEYHFADVAYQRKFDNLRATLLITTTFTSVAVFIACLGLLGLAIYMTEARIKEIGIRKVMGGSIISIVQLLNFSSLKPILFAVVIFTPGSWFLINWWLESFVYRISLDVWPFVLAALSIIGIAFLTISSQTIRAANANPIDSLRNE